MRKDFFRIVFRILISRKFAVYLMLLIAALLLTGAMLPDVSTLPAIEQWRFKNRKPLVYALSSALGIGALKDSYLFLSLFIFLFLSISVCTIKRIIYHRKSADSLDNISRISHCYGSIPFDNLAAQRVMNILRRKGWKPRRSGIASSRYLSGPVTTENESPGLIIMGNKGYAGDWGSIIFHVGMLVTVIGVVVSMMLGFSGAFTLTEGFESQLSRGNLFGVREPERFDLTLPGTMLELKKFEMALRDDVHPVDFICYMLLDGKEEVVKINKPVDIRGFTLTPQKYGFTPKFLIKDGNGNIILDAYVNLEVRGGAEDSFEIPGANLVISARFYPDFKLSGAGFMGQAEKLYAIARNPVFYIKVFNKDKMIAGGFLPQDKPIDFGKYTIIFNDLRHWVYFRVSMDSGMPLLIAGLITGVVGLVWRFYFYDRAIWIRMMPEGIEFNGRSKYFPGLFKEDMEKIIGAARNE